MHDWWVIFRKYHSIKVIQREIFTLNEFCRFNRCRCQHVAKVDRMDKMDCYALIMLYPWQFGKSGFKGASYLSKILRRYVEDGLPAEVVDYRRLISAVAEDQGIRPDSMKKSIRRWRTAGSRASETPGQCIPAGAGILRRMLPPPLS